MNDNECYYCGGSFDSNEGVVVCQYCGKLYHASCYQNNGCVNPKCSNGDDGYAGETLNMQNETAEEYQEFLQEQGEDEEYISTNYLKRNRYILLISLCATIVLAILTAISGALSGALASVSEILMILFIIITVVLAIATMVGVVIVFIFYQLSMGIRITSKSVIIEDPFKTEKSIPLDLITSSTGKSGIIKFFALNTASSIPNIILFHPQSMDYHSILRELIVERKSNQR